MAIKMVPDLGAPLATTAVDLITESYAPDYNEWAAYIMAVGGYVGAWMGWGGDFVKNVGISSLPWAAKKLYDRIKGGATRSVRFHPTPVSRGMRQTSGVGRYPAPHQEAPFQGNRLV